MKYSHEGVILIQPDEPHLIRAATDLVNRYSEKILIFPTNYEKYVRLAEQKK